MAEKKKEKAVITAQNQLADGIFSMWLQTEAAKNAKPGQFLSLYTRDKSKLLPRPISICEIDKEKGCLRIVYRVTGDETGTHQFSKMQPGDGLLLMGPLGNGFPLKEAEGKRALLIGGGIGIPPLLELSKQLNCKEEQIVLGYRNGQTFLREAFEQRGKLYVSTEDGSLGIKGNVMDAVGENGLEADIIYACGPMIMLREVKHYAKRNGIACYLSLEERMACGIGACLACVCQSTQRDMHSNVHNKRVCKDGPVFLASEVEIE